MTWHYEFRENGGYDCMSSAYTVYENGEERFVIDTKDYDDGREPRREDFAHHHEYSAAHNSWEYRRCPVAEAVAQMVCQRMNA